MTQPEKIGIRLALASLALNLMLLAATPASAAGTLAPALQKELSHVTVTNDLLDKIAAVGHDAKARGINFQDDNINMSFVTSIHQVVKKLKKDKPQLSALLAKHDLSARDFVAGLLALTRNQFAADPETASYINRKTLNPANIQFYKKHQTQIDRVLANINGHHGIRASLNSTSAQKTRKRLQKLKNMDQAMLKECINVELPMASVLSTFGLAAGPSHYPGGQQPACNVKGLSKVPLDLAANVPQNALKQALTDIGHGIGEQAGKATLNLTPQLKRGMKEYNVWLSAHCTKKALKK